MAYLYRLTLCVVALWLLPSGAWANQPPQWCEVKSGNTFAGTCDRYFASRLAAASTLSEEALARLNAASPSAPWSWNGALVVGEYNGGNDVSWSRPTIRGVVVEGEGGRIVGVCHMVGDAGSHPSPQGSVESLVCPGEATPESPDPCLQKKGNPAGSWSWIGKAADKFMCDSTRAGGNAGDRYCIIAAHRDLSAYVGGAGCTEATDSCWQSVGPGVYTGGMSASGGCTGNGAAGDATGASDSTGDGPPTPTETANSKSCDGFLGTVNGVTYCAPKGDMNVVESFKSTTATTTTTAGTATQTVTETTKCDPITCVTSKTTTTSGSGTTTSTVTATTTGKGEFCRANPTGVECSGSEVDPSSFSGSCTGGFVCTGGDAATCAIATAVNQSKCLGDKWMTEDAALKAAGTNAINGTGLVGTGTVTVSATDIDRSNPFSNSCPTDLHWSVGGKSVTVPLSSMCTVLQALGSVLVGVSLLVAARIAGGA